MADSCGALDVGEITTILFGIATDCAIGIVALDAISPIRTFAPSDLTSFVAASTDALACVCPSSEPTSCTLAFDSPAACSAFASRSTAAFTARSRFAPYAARSPVNGSTSPILSWNEHGFAARFAVEAAVVAGTESAAASTTTAAFHLCDTSDPPSLGSAATLNENVSGCNRGGDEALRLAGDRGADRGPLRLRARRRRLLRAD